MKGELTAVCVTQKEQSWRYQYRNSNEGGVERLVPDVHVGSFGAGLGGRGNEKGEEGR